MTYIIVYSILVGVLSFAAYELYFQLMAEGAGGEQVPVQTAGDDNQTPSGAEMNLKAVVIGATGATGKYLFAELIKDKRFAKITTIGRRAASIPEDFEGASEINLDEEIKNGRLQQVTSSDIDLNKEINKETVGKYFEGSDIYLSTFGTTRKNAGSAAEFRRIDHGINTGMATVAKEAGVRYCGLMSSHGANSNSFFLYLQVKGQIDDKVKELAFDHSSVWRPGFLDRGGDLRFMEKVAKTFMSAMPVQQVARAMIKDAVSRVHSTYQSNAGHKIFNNADIYAFNGLGSNGKPPNK